MNSGQKPSAKKDDSYRSITLLTIFTIVSFFSIVYVKHLCISIVEPFEAL